MAISVGKDDLQRLTETYIEKYFSKGIFDGMSNALANDVVGFSPAIRAFCRGNWEVRHFLQSEYERLAPCSISQIRSRRFVGEDHISIVVHVAINSMKQRKMIPMNITVMYQMTPGGYAISGINVAIDSEKERSYTIVTARNRADYEYLSAYDSFTGLLNRDAFCSRAADMISDYPDKSFDILRINVERFKVINEVFGEVQGDKLLKYIADFLKSVDLKLCLSGRLYADNFVVCFESGNDEAERLMYTLQVVANSFEINHHTVLTFGLYKVVDKSLPVNKMIERANIALNQVNGSHMMPYCVYEDMMWDRMLIEQKIMNELDSALDNDEFSLMLQPKFELENETIIGAEALVRWVNKEGERIQPSLFVPIFEKNGSIYELDKFMWESVCRQIRKWLDEGKKVLPVSVNVSRIDLYDPKLVNVLNKIVERYNVPKELFELEITESAYTGDPQMIISVVENLQKAGFRILMDDFGSGYSSLNMLKDIYIDVLKIDMGFLQRTDRTGRGTNILAAVVQMADSLKLPTIAEGVETKEQVDLLKSIGCNWAQGFYFSQPISVEDFSKLLK
ncbi:MAG: EAL domain-containing protein [Anaerovibrio sp.]|uniref:putative bifunctional diguanylate cyclase/phosphodiesterase n=1 Tax=Anaerovibrio sp. TaxID=1872532 RepID=UPI0025C36D39|nr:GGDEF domain-containing phosphodiesterase [Anaerovibrio sp.]MBE6099127.1 EAL domain-containing protein [Anaerovibrio sp.]